LSKTPTYACVQAITEVDTLIFLCKVKFSSMAGGKSTVLSAITIVFGGKPFRLVGAMVSRPLSAKDKGISNLIPLMKSFKELIFPIYSMAKVSIQIKNRQ
jgi:hypothetical protein